ncbi:mechanosensitive ion channel family protein [Cytobacillus sp. S13-E01]|uniref:mechanosensitive ion channel family protein n=1 Tax=Cytobacillus sp. S13-E01 TaxID=3031326 RepID=UPI0023D83D52|nr:mechanosensitive ion channel family protein [Cytobacillus sp. S13-E01]MDF0728499.1 mechanosensitive ion channel family protein [Cytobacillus sp. S13-E01]
MNEELWINIGTSLLKIVVILIVSSILIRIGRIAIQNIFKARSRGPLQISERREATLIKLLENVLRYVVYFVVIIMILESMEIEIRALLAGAGIVGLAVGFGAQNLVRDIITGFFIIFEDQFSVGDFIRTGTFEGTVEEIGLRTTKIKAFTGEIHILPNGSIVEVTNFSINNSIAVVDISISYEEDIPKTERVIEELLLELPDKYEDIINPPELLGVQMLGASEVVLRVTCEVLPMRHFYISRVLRKEVKLRLDEHGIEIPYPRLVMYTRNEDNKAKQN